MPKFKTSSDLLGTKAQKVTVQTWANQARAAKQNRPAKSIRRTLKRSKRFTLVTTNKRRTSRGSWNRRRKSA